MGTLALMYLPSVQSCPSVNLKPTTHLLQHALPSGSKKYSIHVPKSTEFQPHWQRYLHQSESRINDTSSRKANLLDESLQNTASLCKAFRPKNNIKNANRIHVGQVLLIPSSGEAKTLVSTKGRSRPRSPPVKVSPKLHPLHTPSKRVKTSISSPRSMVSLSATSKDGIKSATPTKSMLGNASKSTPTKPLGSPTPLNRVTI